MHKCITSSIGKAVVTVIVTLAQSISWGDTYLEIISEEASSVPISAECTD
jgi:hypothetical protein